MMQLVLRRYRTYCLLVVHAMGSATFHTAIAIAGNGPLPDPAWRDVPTIFLAVLDARLTMPVIVAEANRLTLDVAVWMSALRNRGALATPAKTKAIFDSRHVPLAAPIR